MCLIHIKLSATCKIFKILISAPHPGDWGGTRYTVREALRGGRELINLHPDVQLSVRPVDPRLF